jgi:hypothetical protein
MASLADNCGLQLDPRPLLHNIVLTGVKTQNRQPSPGMTFASDTQPLGAPP